MTAAGTRDMASKQRPLGSVKPKEPRALDLAFEVDTGDSRANHMLLIMARIGNSSLVCYASEKTLARRCGFSVSTASRAIDHLKAHSYIKQVILRPRRRQSCTYALCVDLWITCNYRQITRKGSRSNCTSTPGQLERQNQERESGRQQIAVSSRAGASVGECVAPLLAKLKEQPG